MEEMLIFLKNYGLVLTLIALAGIGILGILKHYNCFSKVEEKYRHYLYIGISVAFSLIGSAIYLLVLKQFEVNYFLALAAAILLLNQTCYNLIKATSVGNLFAKIFDFLKRLFTKQTTEADKPSEPDETDKK